MLSNAATAKMNLAQNGSALIHYAFTEYCSPIYQGTMMLQKLALLWMLQEKIEKAKESFARFRKERKEKESPVRRSRS